MSSTERAETGDPAKLTPVRRFIVNTTEHAEGQYVVEAATEDEAKAKFRGVRGAPQIQWEGVEQRHFTVYSVEVDGAWEDADA